MALLVTTKEKYGISVAARIAPELAHRISEKAERLGVSMSKMVGMLITNGFQKPNSVTSENSEANQTLLAELSEARIIIEQKETNYKMAAAEFIQQVADDHNSIEQLASRYNEILDRINHETNDE